MDSAPNLPDGAETIETAMATLSLKSAGHIARKTLFQNLTLTLGPGDCLGLVAQNGTGKSTLLRCLAGEVGLSQGEIMTSRGARVGLVPQEVPPVLWSHTLRNAVLEALPDEQRTSEAWRADMVLDSLEAPQALRGLDVTALSGGWQRLMLLARIWVGEPDALLLDEPTNYLDLEKILLLERWLDAWASGLPVVVASHDRAFLDAATNRTLFLRPEISRLFPLPYSRARAVLAESDTADATVQARDLKAARQLRRQSAKLKNIGINSHSDLLLKKHKQLRQRAEKIEAAVVRLHKERAGEIRLARRESHAKSLVRIEDLTVAAPDDRLLFKLAKLEIFPGDRLVLLGHNGTGKSTLLSLLRRALEAEGAVPGIKATPSLVLGTMDQDLSDLPLGQSPFALVSDLGPDDEHCRALLAAAGIAYDQQRHPIEELSLGQRSRLALLALRLTRPNFYLLDEPTNHLDIEGQEALAEEIVGKGACCLLVSHDRAFVRQVGNRFLVVARSRLTEHASPEPYFGALAAKG